MNDDKKVRSILFRIIFLYVNSALLYNQFSLQDLLNDDWSKNSDKAAWNLASLISNLLSSPRNISLPFPLSILASTVYVGFHPNYRVGGWAPLLPRTGKSFTRSIFLLYPWEHWIYMKKTTIQIGSSVGYPLEPLGWSLHPSVIQEENSFLHYYSISYWSKTSNILRFT